MKTFATIILLFTFATVYSQKSGGTGTIKVKKSGCDNIFLGICIFDKVKDTLTFDQLHAAAGLFARTKNCDQNVTYKINSYGISINGDTLEMITGPVYNFGIIPPSKVYRKITISNCSVEVKAQGLPAKTVIIPLWKFYIRPE
ncbi:MAG: hypothetical protein JWP12_787 [Bacteroidetes bacterium]|nr:hypothetical protein [Bacteroidota bacterium]